jgi:putative glycosyltransferase
MKLSIVTTLFMSAEHIKEFCIRAKKVANKVAGNDYEIIIVNDMSPDESLKIALKMQQADSNITILELSRNFGHQKALMTGLNYCSGSKIFLIDSDLEEQPEWLLDFEDKINNENVDIIYGVQSKRKGRFAERIIGYFYYPIFRLFTGIKQPNNIVTARLMTRKYLNALLLHKEYEVNISALGIITGFNQLHMKVKKTSSSKTTFTYMMKFKLFLDAITSFSSTPLLLIFYMGILISLSSLLYILYLVFSYFFILDPPPGYTTIVASIWMFSGLIIFFIGLQGIYISKIFNEVKNRPLTIIKNIYKKKN